MQNIKLTLRFDGAKFHGWQIQPEDVSVQQLVSDALFELTGEKVNLIGCGRTDAHVHALEYICSFKTNANIPADKYPYGLNVLLPDEIVCVRSEAMADDFHAKHSAKSKNYVYKILNTRFHDPFCVNRAWHIKYPLDIKAMEKAAASFIGTHDFRGFAASGLSVKTTVRTIYDISVYKDGDIITIDVVGNGFLYNMVRIIAGTLVWVGSGKISADDMPEIIASGKRERAGMTAPPDGLYLKGVEY